MPRARWLRFLTATLVVLLAACRGHGQPVDTAGSLYLIGKAARAVALLEDEVRTHPRYARAHFSLGTFYLDLGRPADARGAFAAARELYAISERSPSEDNPFPKYHAATGNLAMALLLLDELAEVPTLIEDSTVPGQDGGQPQQLEVHLHALRGDHAAARAALERYVAITDVSLADAADEKAALEGLANGTLGRAGYLAYLRAVAASAPEASPGHLRVALSAAPGFAPLVRLHAERTAADYEQKWRVRVGGRNEVMRGLDLVRRGRLAEAHSLAARLAEHHPDALGPREIAVLAYKAENRLDQAMAVLLPLTERSPDRAQPWYNLGVLYRESGDFVRAMAAFDRALALRPRYAEANYEAGLVHFERKEHALARARMEREIALHPRHYWAHMGVGALELLHGGSARKAAAHFVRASELRPNHVEPRRRALEAFAKAKDQAGLEAECARSAKYFAASETPADVRAILVGPCPPAR